MKMASLNDYMHPRNPFKVKPNYQMLGEKYPLFKPFLLPYPSNKKFKINFDDPNALRSLSTVLLKDTFNLDVNIPIDRLIPSIPQRVNYILWIEDIIDQYFDHKSKEEKKINLIDCGTGASCVFPLISTRLNDNWFFLATEIDDLSLEIAKRNCESNNLDNRIKVIKGNSDHLIPDLDDEYIVFMCNPPFFDVRNEDSPLSSSNTSQLVESTVEGGEENFVTRLIEQSLMNRTKIKFYTVMLGRMISFKNLKKKLDSYRQDQILNFITTEFCQGKTLRWGLCWTFDLSIELDSIYRTKHGKKKKNPIFVHTIPESKFIYTYSLKIVTNHILELLSKIEINKNHLFNLKRSKYKIEFTVKSNLNTWSHQRRKRRLAKQQIDKSDDQMVEEKQMVKDNQIECQKNRKRMVDELESSFDDLEMLDTKSKDDDDENWKRTKFTQSDDNNEFYLLNCVVKIQEKDEIIFLKITTNDQVKDRDSAHQLFQYLKNNLKE